MFTTTIYICQFSSAGVISGKVCLVNGYTEDRSSNNVIIAAASSGVGDSLTVRKYWN